MTTESKKIIKKDEYGSTNPISSNETDEQISVSSKRKFDLQSSDSENEDTNLNAIYETKLQTNSYLVKKKAKSLTVPTLNISNEKRNSAEEIPKLNDEIMFQNIDSSLQDDLCHKLKSSFEIMKVTKKGDNKKLKKCQPAKTKLKRKITTYEKKLNESVINTEVASKKKIPPKKSSEKKSKGTLTPLNSDVVETSQPLIKNMTVAKQNKKNISDISLVTILNYVKTKIKDPESLQMLSKNWINKLNKIIKSAMKYKERCGREEFTVDDFGKGLLFNGEKPISTFLDMPTGQIKNKKQMNIKCALKNTQKGKKVCLLPDINPHVNGEWLEESPLSKNLCELPDELKVYFKLVTEVFLNSEDESCSIALEDLKMNKNISYLLPSFVDFISSEIGMRSSDFSRISILLKVMQSLLLNPFLYFGHDTYLNTFAYLLLKCLFDPSHYSHFKCDFLLIKDTAAELLACVLKKSKSEKLWYEIVLVLEAAFCDLNHSFVVHYGAIVAINSIGVSAITLAIIPHILHFFEHLNSVEPLDYQKRCDAYAVHGQLLRTYYLLISQFMKQNPEKYPLSEASQNLDDIIKTHISEALLKTYFSEYFGDALVLLFPLQNCVSHKTADEKKIHKVFLNSKNVSKLKVLNKANTVNTLNTTLTSQVDIMFDCIPLKKHTIMFKKLLQET